ncbi:hypothetical protein PYCC9005_003361 [Savitreella phatthalungensis]
MPGTVVVPIGGGLMNVMTTTDATAAGIVNVSAEVALGAIVAVEAGEGMTLLPLTTTLDIVRAEGITGAAGVTILPVLSHHARITMTGITPVAADDGRVVKTARAQVDHLLRAEEAVARDGIPAARSLTPIGALATTDHTHTHARSTTIGRRSHRPPHDAVTPAESDGWAIVVFRPSTCEDALGTVSLWGGGGKSWWLLGRGEVVGEEAVVDVDLVLDHPTCSKQHAVVQFRGPPSRPEHSNGAGELVQPYLIDLESTNGTSLNGEMVPVGRYVELRDGDVLKFGESAREYVVVRDA